MTSRVCPRTCPRPRFGPRARYICGWVSLDSLTPQYIYIYIYILNLSIKFIKTIEWHVMIGHVQILNHWATHILLLRNENFIIYIHFKYIYKKLIDTSCFNPFWILAWYKKNLIIYKKHTWRGWKKIKSLNILVNIYLF